MDINYKLDAFEGPLDLLLHLLEKNKVNIYDIPIVEITNQYLDYVKKMQQQDLDSVSNFLVMAATLLDIKSRMLLPKQETDEIEEDPRAELVQRLLEYKMYKSMAYELKDRQLGAQKVLYREKMLPKEVEFYEEPIDTEYLVKDLSLEKMNSIFNSVMKSRANKIDPIRSKFGRIEKEEVSVEDKIIYVEEYAMNHSKFSFKKLLENQHSKMQTVVTFLAILELIKMGKLTLSQDGLFEDIYLHIKSKAA